jgi:hypothetical protein
MKRIIDAIKRFVKFWHDSRVGSEAFVALLKQKIDEVDAMGTKYAKLLDSSPVIYTSVQTFVSPEGEKQFWPWVKSVLVSDQYRFLIFSLRESVIREMAQASDVIKLHEMSGRLQMLQVIDNYLTRGLKEYESASKQA